ncbi:MAG: XdhC family protein [Cyanobacteria bacterium P01_D01_bin.156]
MTQTTLTTKTSSLDFFSCLVERLIQGPVVVAIVTATHGDVGSQIGEKLLIWGDAQTMGSLTEHTVKATVITQSFAVMKTGISQRIVIDPGNNLFAVTADPEAPQSTAQVHVWLIRWQGAIALSTAKAALAAINTGQKHRLVIPLVTGQFPYILGAEGPSLRNLQGQDAYLEDL